MTRELDRIATLRARFAGEHPQIAIDIGDDCAVLAASALRQALSVDVAVENVHFRREWAAIDVIGARAFMAAASDLAAMGASPRAALSSLVLPSWVDDAAFAQLVDGIARAAEACGMPVVGGNLARGGELSITTTVIGEVGAPLTRSGARVGDGIYVTGTLGAAALGLRYLMRSEDDRPDGRFVERWRRPHARLLEGKRLAGHATAAIDVSDGLLRDLGHLATASGVGASVLAEAIPLAPGYADACAALGLDPVALACTGGEDYELLFTAEASVTVSKLATRIGRIEPAGHGVAVLGPNGERLSLEGSGFDHFG